LIVTNPVYPMIEMWDAQFSELNPQIETYFHSRARITRKKIKYRLNTYEFKVVTSQETEILMPFPTRLKKIAEGKYEVHYSKNTDKIFSECHKVLNIA
jgi:hypothetical protein